MELTTFFGWYLVSITAFFILIALGTIIIELISDWSKVEIGGKKY